MHRVTDSALLDRMRCDDESALKMLFERYYHRLCDFSFQYVRNLETAEEAVSDVFMKLWRNREKLNPSLHVKAYLYTSARNQSLNYLEKEQQREFEFLDESDFPAGDRRTDGDLIYRELENRIEILLSTLPPKRKVIFMLHRIEGFSYKEIAEILSISIHTVQNQMVKAVKQLASYSEVNDR